MSLPDHELEEPSDQEFCEEHNRHRPCYRCKVEASEARADAERDERADH